ncbi:hypothetical protein PAXRUDRAFT_409303 [Paxillus rubicundulus Ve08.2h10]|uniref:Uncharacterized protein n=1 Tax=Paxillus rubicundulus Ve08.2h10 TaxID=930991 RepID=A0A0D0E2V7_9AGAM|nr:hypothetical protein PAXRUDRAFT_409303 [Paxillus rubicundulus Ve08.2h10]
MARWHLHVQRSEFPIQPIVSGTPRQYPVRRRRQAGAIADYPETLPRQSPTTKIQRSSSSVTVRGVITRHVQGSTVRGPTLAGAEAGSIDVTSKSPRLSHHRGRDPLPFLSVTPESHWHTQQNGKTISLIQHGEDWG